MWQTRSSYRAPPESVRQSLFPPRQLLAFVSLMLAVVALVFHQQHLAERLRISRSADDASLIYLRSLLRANPNDSDLRLQLTGVYTRRGDLVRARTTLQPLLDENPGAAVLRIEFDLRARQVYRLPKGSPSRRAGVASLGIRLQEIAPALHKADDLIWLAFQARAHNRPELAAQSFGKLARIDAEQPHWHVKAAESLRAAGLARSAASEYFTALAKSSDRSERRSLYRAGIDALLAAGEPRQALQAAVEHETRVDLDRDTLLLIIRLARSANRADVAERYVKNLLRLTLADRLDLPQLRLAAGEVRPEVDRQAKPARGFDEEAYAVSYEVFLANRNLDDAVRVAASAVLQQPTSPIWRERYARICEWAGQAPLALQQWRWLAKNRGKKTDWEQFERLARATNDIDAQIEVLTPRAEQGELDDEGWNTLIRHFEAIGEPERAIAYVRRYGSNRPERLWMLAELQERSGYNAEALSTYKRSVQNAAPEQIMRAAQLMISQERLEEALHMLKQQHHRVPDSATDYWLLMGDLAWQTGDSDTARLSYEKILPDSQTGRAYERYFALNRARDPDLVLESLLNAWHRLKQPRLLMLALGLMVEKRQWEGIAALTDALDEAVLDALQTESWFWQMRGQARFRLGRHREGADDWQRALNTSGDSVEVLHAYIWALIEQHDRRRLAADLPKLERAATTPELMEAAYAGRLLLEQPLAAKRWIERLLKRSPADRHRLLAWADLTQQTGQIEFAERLYRNLARGQTKPEAYPKRTEDWSALRLWLKEAGADARWQVWRELASSRPGDVTGNEILLSGLTDPAYSELVRYWYAYRLPGLPTPNAASLLAGSTGDAEQQQRWLEQPERLSPTSRIDALDQVGRNGEAMALRFEMLQQTDTQAMRHAFAESALPLAHQLLSGIGRQSIGDLERIAARVSWSAPIKNGIRFAWIMNRFEQTATSPRLGALDSIRLDQGFFLDWDSQRSLGLQAGLWRADLPRARVGQSLQADWKIGTRHGLSARGSRLEPTTEQDGLAAWSTSSGLELKLDMRLHRRNTLSFSWADKRFHDAWGRLLSSVERSRADWTYAVVDSKPNLVSQLSFVHQDGKAGAEPDCLRFGLAAACDPQRFILADDTTAEWTLASGENYAARRFNTWLPIARIGSRYSFKQGWSHGLTLGVSHNLTVADRLTFRYSAVTSDQVGRGGSELWLEYRHVY